MQDHSFRSKGPDLLRDLAAHAERVLVEYGDIAQDRAQCLALEIVERIARAWGGQNMYFPMGTSWRSHQLAQKIWSEFDGQNAAEVARNNGISIQWAYSLIRAMRAEETKRRQGGLF